MSNINFDNPWLLLLGIPLLLLVTIPFVIAVRRENRNMHNVFALCIHLLIAVALTLALAGMNYDATITRTQVYVLADVSYSSNNNLDVLDGYVKAVENDLPKNASMAVIAFGRNYQLLSDLGEPVVSVRNADEVDAGATDIAAAMRYAGNLFEDDVIKRIVVITDGKQTAGNDRLTSVVTRLKEEDVYIDVIYLDNNLADDVREIQLTDVSYTTSAFMGREEKAQLQVHCNNDGQTHVYVDVETDGKTVSYAHILYKGENLLSVPLDTTAAGTHEYTVTLRPEQAQDDTSPYNNTCLLTQNVSETVNILFVGGSSADCTAGRAIYGTENIKYISDASSVPCTVEELCKYDQIVLCNFDVRTMTDSVQFVSNLETVVSQFGKTLTTYGNTFVQDTETVADEALESLSGMLPVTVGNAQKDSRLLVILLDISTSTNFSSRLAIIREATEKLLDTMDESDKIMVLGFSGDNMYLQSLTEVRNRDKILRAISSYTCRNGTYLKGGMEVACTELLNQNYHRRELVIISDGLFNASEEADCLALAEKMSANNIVVSALGVYPTADETSLLEKLVKNSKADGKGYYQAIQSQNDIDYVIGDIVEQMQEVRVEGDSYKLTLQRPMDTVLGGVDTLPDINGFWYSAAKPGVEAVITAQYWRDKTYSLEVPVYASWQYGNGRVSAFLSDISGDWTAAWQADDDAASEAVFLQNIRTAMIPDSGVESPFLITPTVDGSTTTVSVVTSAFRSEANLTMTLYAPDGSARTQTMYFDTDRYLCSFDTDQVGRYRLLFVYDYGAAHYEVEADFAISYHPEYDAFATYNVASLYRLISENGEVSLDGKLRMDNSESTVRNYTFSFVVPLMAACAVLFVLDVIIRMLRWKDIRSLFGRKRKTA